MYIFFSSYTPFCLFHYKACNSSHEDLLLPSLVLPGPNGVNKCTESHCDNDEYDSEEDTIAMEDSEEDMSKSSDVTAGDWLPKIKSGLKKKLIFSSTSSGTDAGPDNHVTNSFITCCLQVECPAYTPVLSALSLTAQRGKYKTTSRGSTTLLLTKKHL